MRQRNFINFSEKEIHSPLYRIFSLQRFLESLERKALTLVNPSLWEDPFENFIHQYFKKVYSDPSRVMRWYGGNLVGQCWTLHRETDAMWRIYSPDKNGVKVRVNSNALLEGLWSSHGNLSASTCCYLGKVSYQTKKELSKIINNPNLEHNLMQDDTAYKRALFLLQKRNEFSHEKEARLIYEFTSNQQLRDNQYYDVSIDPNALYEQIVLDPRMSDTEFKMYKSGIKALGYKGRITQSSLYNLDILT